MCILATLKLLKIRKSLLLQMNQYTSQQFLIVGCYGFQTVWHHVVDILYEHHVSLDVVKVLDERTMATRTEQQRPILVAERRVVCIGSYCVSTGLLFRETNIIFHTKHFLIQRQFLLNRLLEKLKMLVRHGKMYVCLAVRLCIESSLHQMLLNGCAHAFLIFVEEQQALGQLTIVKPLWQQQVCHNILITSCLDELTNAHTLVGLAFLA